MFWKHWNISYQWNEMIIIIMKKKKNLRKKAPLNFRTINLPKLFLNLNSHRLSFSKSIKFLQRLNFSQRSSIWKLSQPCNCRTCYAANCRPDALMKEQMVEMTGLSPRVIRVWFQNKRCKDKKRAILMKQMQQEKVWIHEVNDALLRVFLFLLYVKLSWVQKTKEKRGQGTCLRSLGVLLK